MSRKHSKLTVIIIDGNDVDTPAYHQTHSCYAVAAFHEALRIILGYGRRRKASDYAYHEKALRQAVEAMGCEVTSNTPSLALHREFGFHPCGVIRHAGYKFGRWLDLEFHQLVFDGPRNPTEG